jgi:toluene monooxygenase electron transfer component
VLRIEIIPERPVAFEPGQFMLVRVPDVPGYRGWSMARFERPASRLVFTVKLMPKGSISGWLAARSRVGTPVELFGPMGRAFFQPTADKNLLCVAGGSGLAPMLAILESAVASGHLQRFRADLFFGVRRLTDLYAMDELMALRDRAPGLGLTVALSDEAPGREATMRYPNVTFASGFVHAVAGHAMVQRYADVTAFLAGPPVMVDAAMRLLITEAKLPARQIRYDKFS